MALLDGLLHAIRGSIHFSAQEVKKEKPKRSAKGFARHEILNEFLRPIHFSHAAHADRCEDFSDCCPKSLI